MINEIFTYTETDYSLTEADEVATIEAAQAGDEAAKLTLLRAYGPALRASVRNFGRGVVDGRTSRGSALEMGNADLDVEDLQSTALLAFFEVIEAHDPELNPRLAGRVSKHLAKRLDEAMTPTASFTVPARTLSRFYGILKAAEGDAAEAERIAPSYELSTEAFRSIYAAVRGTGSLTPQSEDDEERAASSVFTSSPVSDAEDSILVEVAFRAVDDDEERICRLSYGFTEYDPQPDAEIAHRMGLTRPTVQRKRAKALGKMRKALGATLAE